MRQDSSRLAVVLFNLGGPDSLSAVEPFLANLFNDPAIISLPGLFRSILARVISKRRAPAARHIYEQMGGSSPLLPETRAQAAALEQRLSHLGAVRVFIAMRYWHPFTEEAAAAVHAFGPDAVVLLPLYPQFSSTTTGSSIAKWREAAAAVGLSAPTHAVCCYPSEAEFVAAHAQSINAALAAVPQSEPVRVLFSAHGLPERKIAAGDPYQWQVERTVAAVVAHLDRPMVDWRICYQSRVGPLAWIGPPTDAEIKRAGQDGKGLIVVPIAFVSEHSETLVELDQEYGRLAQDAGVPFYHRIPALGISGPFIDCLATMTEQALGRTGYCSEVGERLCPARLRCCPQIPAALERS